MIVIAAFCIFIYINMKPLELLYAKASLTFFPCATPIKYSIGSIDPRFDITKADFLKTMSAAESIWETPVNKNLFEYSENGALKVDLVYDERQQATEKFKTIGGEVKTSKASYEAVRAKYLTLKNDYSAKKARYQTQITQYEKEKRQYDAEVEKWNTQGGAPQDVYAALSVEKEQLNKDLASIHSTENSINTTVTDINATVSVLNLLVRDLNLKVNDYNDISGGDIKEFTAGVYENSSDGEKIEIYQFESEDKLLRVLAHELGHAIGLVHIDTNPKAIMYWLNEGVNDTLTSDDLVALKKQCKLK